MNKKLVIAQIVPRLIGGGVERGCLEVAQAIIARGGRALVVSGGGRLVPELTKIGAEHFELPVFSKNPLRALITIYRLRQLLLSNGVHIAHALSRVPAWLTWFATCGTPCHFATSIHGLYGYQNWFKKFYSSIMARGERILAISEFLRNHMIKVYGVAADRIITVHRGVDAHQFSLASPEQLQNILKFLPNYTENHRLIVLIGRFGANKGHELLLSAIGLLPQPIQDKCYLAFVGYNAQHSKDQRLKARLSHQAAEIGFHNLAYVPFTSDIAGIYAQAFLVVNCSLSPEGFGRTLIEAGAAHRIALAAQFSADKSHGPAPEIIDHGKKRIFI